ncbi:hypothetical protein [Thermonema rossianum]|uniref:hypothetical protein n=1 Tax=Thermonema rossianum TaxID=55505 RepID=UPI0012FCFEF6|nr:hypothetical protein [Thermonema rossianum]
MNMLRKLLIAVLLTAGVVAAAYFGMGGHLPPEIRRLSLQKHYFLYRLYEGRVPTDSLKALRRQVQTDWQSHKILAWAAAYPHEPQAGELIKLRLGVLLDSLPAVLPAGYSPDTLKGEWVELRVQAHPVWAPRPYELHERAQRWAKEHQLLLSGEFIELMTVPEQKIVILYKIQR